MSAVLSPCGTYRLRLDRDSGRLGRTLGVIMVNPSTAAHEVDDQTIVKVRGFAIRNDFDRIVVGNKFAFRATDVRALRIAPDPIGPENDAHLRDIIDASDILIVAWGSLGKLPKPLRERWRDVVALAGGKPLFCLGTTRDGHPRHPLFVPYEQPIVPWRAPCAA